MFKSIVPITKERHLKKKVRATDNFDFIKDVHIASIMVHEFSRASSVYPIVFLEDQAEDRFRPVVLTGLEEGENLFIKDNKWEASYIPAIIRRYPFALARTGEDGRYTVCIDEESVFVNEEEGESLFTEDGEAGEVIDRVKQYLTELQQMEIFTTEFCKFMSKNNMFTPLNMKVRVGSEVKNISGAYVINEDRFNALSDEKFIELRAKKYISVIYAHLSSLAQIERLIEFQDKRRQIERLVEFQDKRRRNGASSQKKTELESAKKDDKEKK